MNTALLLHMLQRMYHTVRRVPYSAASDVTSRERSLIRLASALAEQPATKTLRNDCSTVHHSDQCHKTMLGPDQLREYLEHVQLSGKALRPSLATLVTLHRQHAKCIPFSNITIAQGPTLLKELKFPHEIPDISPDGLIKKLVRRKWYEQQSSLSPSHVSKKPTALGWVVRSW